MGVGGAIENLIGGVEGGAPNFICGNAGSGIQFMDAATAQNRIVGNIFRANGGAVGGSQSLLAQNIFELNK